MGMNEYNSDFGCTPMEYRGQIDSLIGALGLIGSPSDMPGHDVIRLATQFIYNAPQCPSRRQIAAMAMQGLLSNPGFREDVVHGRIAKMAIDEADNLIYHLNADPVAEGVNLLPMYSRGLDEGLDNDQDRGVSR